MKPIKKLPLHVLIISLLMIVPFGSGLYESGVFAQSITGIPQHGHMLFEENCRECHGRTGDGMGPVGYFLDVRPADLLSIETRMKSDSELFTIIKDGILFDEMHGWEGVLSDQDIRDVISYIRNLAPPIPRKK